MSLSNRGRRLSVAPLAGVERQGRGSLGSGSLAVGISYSLPSDSRFIQGTHPLPGLQSRFHPGQGLGGGSSFVVGQGSNRAGSSSFSGLLQPVIRGDETLRSMEAGHRPLATESEGSEDILQIGDSPVNTSVSTSWGLDGVSRLEGCVLAGPDASGVSQVPQIRGVREGVPIQSSLLWPIHSSSGFHTGHGCCFGISSLDRHSVTSVSRRLVDPSLLSGTGPPCFGDSSSALQFVRDSRQLDGVSGSSFGLNLFQGFSCPEESREASLNWRRILIGIHITCTTDTAQTPNHPTLMYNIFTSTLGIKCTLPVSYACQQPRAAPADPHLPHHFIYCRHRTRCSSAYSLTHIHSVFIVAGFWTSFWTSFWISSTLFWISCVMAASEVA